MQIKIIISGSGISGNLLTSPASDTQSGWTKVKGSFLKVVLCRGSVMPDLTCARGRDGSVLDKEVLEYERAVRDFTFCGDGCERSS